MLLTEARRLRQRNPRYLRTGSRPPSEYSISDLADYFVLPEWPMREGPLGRTFQLVTKKRPELFPEQCLECAKKALQDVKCTE